MWHELPLVIFTIIAQMSVGSFVVLGFINILGIRKPQEVLAEVTRPALLAIGPLLIAGFAASTFHLGSPLRAANSLINVGGSWLSREILVGSAFLALGAIFAFTELFNWFGHRVRQLIAFVAAAVGVCLVLVIGQVYSLRTVPAWATPLTTVRFFITTFLLGSLAVSAALVLTLWIRRNRISEAGRRFTISSLRWLSLAAVVALGIKFVSEPLYLGYLASHPSSAAQSTLHLLTDTYLSVLVGGYGLILLALLLIGFVLFRLSGSTEKLGGLSWWILLAFIVALCGEFFGRVLFYATMVRVGM